MDGFLNRVWCDWFYFSMANGADNGDKFDHRVHHCDEANMLSIRLMGTKLIKNIQQEILNSPLELPETPPKLCTSNGKYLSQAWVMDTARRDLMPVYEAVALGCSLIAQLKE